MYVICNLKKFHYTQLLRYARLFFFALDSTLHDYLGIHISGVALAASPASPGAGLSFNIWQVLSGFSKLNKRKTGQMSKMQGKFQSKAGLRKLTGATPAGVQ